jgi:hypothetical protein
MQPVAKEEEEAPQLSEESSSSMAVVPNPSCKQFQYVALQIHTRPSDFSLSSCLSGSLPLSQALLTSARRKEDDEHLVKSLLHLKCFLCSGADAQEDEELLHSMASGSDNMQCLESQTEAEFRTGVFEKSKQVITRVARFINTLRNLDSQLEALKGFLSTRTATRSTVLHPSYMLQPDCEAAFIQKRLAQLHTMTAQLATAMSRDTQALQAWAPFKPAAVAAAAAAAAIAGSSSNSLTGSAAGHEDEPTSADMQNLLEKSKWMEDSLAGYLKLVKETEKNLNWNMDEEQGTLLVFQTENSAFAEEEDDNKWLPHPLVSFMQLRISELQERSSAIAWELNNHSQILLAVLLQEATHIILTCPLNKTSYIHIDQIFLAKEVRREFPELTRLFRSVAHAKEAIGQTRAKYLKQTLDALTWSKLPENTMELIFARLPLKAIFRLRSLNQHWKSFIFSTSFQQLFSDVPLRRPVGLFCDLIGLAVNSMTFDTCAHEWFSRHLHSPPSSPTHIQPLVTAGGLVACCFRFSHTTAADLRRRIVVMNPTTNSRRMLPPCHFPDVEPSLIKMETNEPMKVYTITLMYTGRTVLAQRHHAATTPESWIIEIYDSSTDCWSTETDMNSRNIEGQIFKLISNWNWSLLEKFTYFNGQTRLPIETVLRANLEATKTMLKFDSQGHAYAFCWSPGSEGIWECEFPWLDWKKIISIPESALTLNIWTSFWVWKDMFWIGRRDLLQPAKLCVWMFDNRKQCWKKMEVLAALSWNERHCWAFETRFDAVP